MCTCERMHSASAFEERRRRRERALTSVGLRRAERNARARGREQNEEPRGSRHHLNRADRVGPRRACCEGCEMAIMTTAARVSSLYFGAGGAVGRRRRRLEGREARADGDDDVRAVARLHARAVAEDLLELGRVAAADLRELFADGSDTYVCRV